MHIFTYIDKDATIYEKSKALGVATSEQKNQNTGLDSILEIQKYKIDGNFYNSRALVYFDMTALSSEITDGTITNATHSLIMYSANSYDIPLTYQINAFPVSESWEMGTGKVNDLPIVQDGVSWKYRDGYLNGSGSAWAGSSFTNVNGEFTATGSSDLGGTYYKGHTGDTDRFTHTQNFNFEVEDLKIDVTNTITAWHTNTFTNQGFILKRPDSQENDNSPYGNLQFFSRDTHTIYLPRLETKWDDSSWDTGSLTELDVGKDIIVYMKGIKPEYKNTAVEKFKISGRNRIVAKTYATQSDYLTVKYLPQTTYYSVRDVSTDEVLIDFSDCTKISCDSNGNFFNFRMSTLQPERYYKFLFKVVSGSSTQIFDDNKFQFKVVR